MGEDMATPQGVPRYTGLVKYVAEQDGYALWLPVGWQHRKMRKGRRGVIFSPYSDNVDTSFTAEKTKLPLSVTHEDLPTLREGFKKGLSSLPGATIEFENEVTGEGIFALEARLTFQEGLALRKRWVRVIYADNAQLVLIAQGRTPEDFDYWLPVFYNIMMTVEL